MFSRRYSITFLLVAIAALAAACGVEGQQQPSGFAGQPTSEKQSTTSATASEGQLRPTTSPYVWNGKNEVPEDPGIYAISGDALEQLPDYARPTARLHVTSTGSASIIWDREAALATPSSSGLPWCQELPEVPESEKREPTEADLYATPACHAIADGIVLGPPSYPGVVDLHPHDSAESYEFHDRYQEFEPDNTVEPAITRQQAIDAAVEKVLGRIGYPDIPEVREALDIRAAAGLYWGYQQTRDKPVSEERSEWPIQAEEVWLVKMRNLPEFHFFYDPGPSRDREGPPIAVYTVGAQLGALINSEGRGEGESRDPKAWQTVRDLMETEDIPWPTNDPGSGPHPTPTATAAN